MTRHDTYNYIGILAICGIIVLSMLYVQKHVDSFASRYNQEKHGKIDFRSQKPSNLKKEGK